MAETKFDADDGSVEIHGEHPNNPNEKPVTVPENGDDGMPVQQDEPVEQEPITIISDSERQRLDAEKKVKAPDDEEETDDPDDDETTRELKRLRNRARRQANKDRQRKAESFKNAEINRLKRELQEVRSLVNNNTRISQLETSEIQVQRIQADASTRFTAAERKLDEAFKAGDAESHRAATKELYEAQSVLEKAATALKNIDIQKKTPETPQQNTFVAERGAEFRKNNPWYDEKLGDRDSRVANRISLRLLNEGLDPNTDEYWEELEDELADALPKKVSKLKDNEDDEDEEPEKQQKQQVKQKLPISGGGGKEVRKPSSDGTVSTSDITPLQRSILRQMGFTEGSKEWMDMALTYKQKNKLAQNK